MGHLQPWHLSGGRGGGLTFDYSDVGRTLLRGPRRSSLLVYPSSRRRKLLGTWRPEAQAVCLGTVRDVRVWVWATVPTTDRPVPEAPRTSASLRMGQ